MKNLYFILLFLPLFSLGQNTLYICSGFDITGDSYSVSASDPNNDLSWSVIDQTGNPVAVADLTGADTEIVTINWTGVPAGVYTLQFTETNTDVDCSETVETTVTLIDGFTATITAENICEGSLSAPYPTINIDPTLNVTYDWGSADVSGNLDLSQITEPYTGGSVSTNPQPFQGTVIITDDDNGCTSTLTDVFYNVYPIPTPGAITSTP